MFISIFPRKKNAIIILGDYTEICMGYVLPLCLSWPTNMVPIEYTNRKPSPLRSMHFLPSMHARLLWSSQQFWCKQGIGTALDPGLGRWIFKR